MTEGQKNHIQEIFEKAKISEKGLCALLETGRRTGFDKFVNRKEIWPFLLELDAKKLQETPVFQWKGNMTRNSLDFQQLQKDADRSLSSMKTFESITKFHLKKKQEAVLAVLDSFFAKNTDLKYIQGFHDVASIFLILFGNSTGYYLMERAGRTYFSDFLKFQFGDVGRSVSQIVYEIVTREDPDFVNIYSSYQDTKLLIFILPWILTWFSHNFSSVKTICRIWDYLLCTGPHGIFYLTSGIILTTKKELLQYCEQQLDEPTIQTFYQQQSKNQEIDIQLAIAKAIQLEDRDQVGGVEGWKRLEPESMIRWENFEKVINIHRGYRQERRRRLDFGRKLWKVAKVGATVLVIVATFYVIKTVQGGKGMAKIGQF